MTLLRLLALGLPVLIVLWCLWLRRCLDRWEAARRREDTLAWLGPCRCHPAAFPTTLRDQQAQAYRWN